MNSLDAFLQAIESMAADVLFGFIVLGVMAVAILLVLFAGLLLRGAWRWLTRATWKDVVTSLEQKAFRGRVSR